MYVAGKALNLQLLFLLVCYRPCDTLPQFEDVGVTRSHVLVVVHHIQGGASPGGCNAGHCIVVLLHYGAHSSCFCDAVATLVRRLLNTITPWDSIHALVANHLIVLDKCPGVCPIGIGETLPRIVGTVVCLTTSVDAELACGTDQLCGRVKGGIEAAVHAMNDLLSLHSNSAPGWQSCLWMPQMFLMLPFKWLCCRAPFFILFDL